MGLIFWDWEPRAYPFSKFFRGILQGRLPS